MTRYSILFLPICGLDNWGHFRWGYIFALGATAVWSVNFIIARGLNEAIHPVSLAFWRWTVAIIAFLPFALKPLIAEWAVLKKHILYLSVTALLGITISNTLIYFAGHTTTAINLSLIAITFPVFIIIVSQIFFKEKITILKGIGIILVLMGVALLITRGVLSSLLNLSFAIGDLWMLLAAISFALYSILLKWRPKEMSILAFQMSIFILGIIFLFPFFVWEYTAVPQIKFSLKTISSILYVGIFDSLVASILWNKAVTAIGPPKAGMVYYTLPIFSGILAYIFLNEAIGWLHFYSVLLIVSGILIANRE